MSSMNVFRILADLSHTASKCVLIWAIHWNHSAEGVSLITQVLYLVVFLTRYLDLFWVPPWYSWWLFVLKNLYIWSSLYILILMTRIYARTREREKAWRLGGFVALGSLVAAPLTDLIFRGPKGTTFTEILWTFSIILESVCVLPQLLLLRQTTVPTVIDSFYLLLLGSYRALYILNWFVRAVGSEHHFDPISVIFGVVQTALYVDFAWVYWTRQRVKLRGGGIVDSDDFRKAWLVNRVLGGQRTGSTEDEEAIRPEDEEDQNGHSRKPNNWGVRGISVSADDTLHDYQSRSQRPPYSIETPQESRGMLQDDASYESDDEMRNEPATRTRSSHLQRAVLNSEAAWEDGRGSE